MASPIHFASVPITMLTAGNAGPFTGKGTNTYIVGRRELVVVDPGPLDAAHLHAILAVAAGRRITHIVATHAHRDHVDGLAALQSATGAITVGYKRAGPPPGGALDVANSPSGGDFVDWAFAPGIVLGDGDRIEAGDTIFEAIHTPGHAPDHLCFALAGRQGEPSVLFSGDHVMGWSTSVIAPPEGHMGDYLRSLERVLARPEQRYLPGHGDPVDDGPRTARAYLLHRQMREQAVIAAVRKGAETIPAITDIVYEGLAANLVNAARLSVLAHLELLAEKGLMHFESDGNSNERRVAERPS